MNHIIPRMLKKGKFLLSALLLFIPLSSFAWWSTGHEIVAQVAYDNLTPAARQGVNALLQAPLAWPNAAANRYLPSPSNLAKYFNSMVMTSSWPDVLNIYTWNNNRNDPYKYIYKQMHFIDVPIYIHTSLRGTPAPIRCDAINWRRKINKTLSYSKNDNVLSAVRSASKTLMSPTTTTVEQRAIALRFLIHYAGDISQPLHASDPTFYFYNKTGQRQNIRTRGGNLMFFSQPISKQITEFHALWDSTVGLFKVIPAPTNSAYNPNGMTEWRHHGPIYLAYIHRAAKELEQQYGNSNLAKKIQTTPAFLPWTVRTSRNACKVISSKYYGKDISYKAVSGPKGYSVEMQFGKGGSKAYMQNPHVRKIITSQLYIAGMHLAHLLNAIFSTPEARASDPVLARYWSYTSSLKNNSNIMRLDKLASAIQQK